MYRKVAIIGAILIGLHVVEILLLGISLTGSLVANTLQLIACGLAAAMACRASVRARGLARPLWSMVALAMATWGVANLGWMYYENVLHVAIPPLSVIRILFDTQGVFFAIALFLDKEKDSPRFDAETLLDSVQIAIVFFSGFFGLYYVQLMSGGANANTDAFMVWSFQIINISLVLLSAVVTLMMRTKRLRALYGGLTAFLTLNAALAGLADYVQSVHNVSTGTWYDLGWTVPFLACAVWAAWWQEPVQSTQEIAIAKRKSLGMLAFRNVMLGVAPLIVLAVVAQLGPEWRRVGLLLLGISVLCYAARLAVSQYHEARSAEMIRRDTLAMDSAMDGMAIVSSEGKYTYVNAAYAKLMGHGSAKAMVGQYWVEMHSPSDVKLAERQIREGLAREGKWFGPVMIRRNGVPVPTEVSITKLPDGGVVTIGRDVSERQRVERSRQEAETKYQTLIEQVAAVSYIAEMGMNGQWLYVSPQVETMFGFAADEWLADSREWSKHIHPEDRAIVEIAEEASKRGERFQAEYRIVRKDGRIIWVSDTAAVVPGSDSHPLMEGIIIDITDKKQLEGQLQQARRMEAVGRLAGGIAHDFNNLLTVIKGYTELALIRTKGMPEIRSDVERIEDASERAAGLVRQLLAFSRRQVMQPKILDLNGIVVGLDKLLRRLMDEDIEMVTIANDSIGAIKADPGQIEQVIMNLVVNARDAMPSGGRLTVETANVELDALYARDHATVKPGKYVMLAVSDTGIGMSADTVAHIFEPFYTTKESGRGTGLGLSTVYGIVKQSGGYIWVYSELDHGTTFKVYLPRVEEVVEPAVGAGKPASSPVKDLSGRETILLVEDEPELRELTRTVLTERGYNVIEAMSAEGAERLATQESGGSKIHLLLTDVIMPGVSGRELAKRVLARQPSVRVLYMSGYTYNVIAENGTLERGVAFLQKPFTPSGLVEKVREVLDMVVTGR
ncbi:MAG: PAS domain S-box protein [Acidobacteria bacterium]|nr:PAS domain S-box protein [Acidobacteriota bacterium]